MHTGRRRLVATIGLGLIVLLGFLGPVDRLGEVQLADATKRALVAFATARGINAAISAVQGTEVALQPAGVGLTLTPGQLLDPINDLVERLSWVMLASAVSLGIQQLLLAVSASSFMGAALLAAAVVGGLWLWQPWCRQMMGATWIVRLAMLTLLLRFAMPAYVLVAEGFYQGFLAQQYSTATQQLEQTRESIEKAQAAEQPSVKRSAGAGGLWSKITDSFDDIRNAADLNGRIERYSGMVGNLADNVINLVVVFVVQSVLMPLLFLWALFSAARAILRTA